MIGDVVMAYEQPIKFVEGFAGSGKSTHLAAAANDKTLVLTPTHKAARVLQNKGVKNVYTIHSVLGLVPTLNQNYKPGKQRMQKLKRVGSTELSEMADIFIDEFSMINVEILDLLLELLPDTCRVTIYGDPYQLPPVDGEAVDPLGYTEDIEELTTQHRAEAPEVVETFMRFMNFIKGSGEKNLRMNLAIKGGNLNDFNPDTDRVLAYTNAKVGSLNKQIANVLNMPEQYEDGDKLVANQLDCLYAGGNVEVEHNIYPNCISKGRLMDPEKLDTVVRKTEEDMDKYGSDISMFSKCNIELEDKVYSIHYDIDHYATQKKLKENVDRWQKHVYNNNEVPEDMKLANWCRENRSAAGVKERGKAWANYISHSNLVFNLQRPWATTIHKSQGSEFDTVYIAQADIKRSIMNNYYETYARLMYVALSRAIKRVVIIS